MKSEDLIALLRKHPGKDVFVHKQWDDCWEAMVLGATEWGVFLGAEGEHANLPEFEGSSERETP